MGDDHDSLDWGKNGEEYDAFISPFTKQHADTIVQSLVPRFKKEETKTIIDVGCGAGAFALSYLEVFPQGFPWQTIVSMDVSSRILAIAKRKVESMAKKLGCQTKFEFVVSDGVEALEKDEHLSNNTDIIVGCFSIFHMSDAVSVLKTIKNVLDKNPNSLLVTTAWTEIPGLENHKQVGNSVISLFDYNYEQFANEFGLEPPGQKREITWSDEQNVMDKFKEIGFHRVFYRNSIHTFILPDEEHVWTMLSRSSPFLDIDSLDTSKVENIKHKVFKQLKVVQDVVTLYSSCCLYFGHSCLTK